MSRIQRMNLSLSLDMEMLYLLNQTVIFSSRHNSLLFVGKFIPSCISADLKEKIIYYTMDFYSAIIFRKYFSSSASTSENSVKGLIVNYQQRQKISLNPRRFLPCWQLIIQLSIEFSEATTVEEKYFITFFKNLFLKIENG